MSGTDHWTGIDTMCPHGCGARWGGLIPKMHHVGCPSIQTPTVERVAATIAENARVRAANVELCRQIADGEVLS